MTLAVAAAAVFPLAWGWLGTVFLPRLAVLLLIVVCLYRSSIARDHFFRLYLLRCRRYEAWSTARSSSLTVYITWHFFVSSAATFERDQRIISFFVGLSWAMCVGGGIRRYLICVLVSVVFPFTSFFTVAFQSLQRRLLLGYYSYRHRCWYLDAWCYRVP